MSEKTGAKDPEKNAIAVTDGSMGNISDDSAERGMKKKRSGLLRGRNGIFLMVGLIVGVGALAVAAYFLVDALVLTDDTESGQSTAPPPKSTSGVTNNDDPPANVQRSRSLQRPGEEEAEEEEQTQRPPLVRGLPTPASRSMPGDGDMNEEEEEEEEQTQRPPQARALPTPASRSMPGGGDQMGADEEEEEPTQRPMQVRGRPRPPTPEGDDQNEDDEEGEGPSDSSSVSNENQMEGEVTEKEAEKVEKEEDDHAGTEALRLDTRDVSSQGPSTQSRVPIPRAPVLRLARGRPSGPQAEPTTLAPPDTEENSEEGPEP